MPKSTRFLMPFVCTAIALMAVPAFAQPGGGGRGGRGGGGGFGGFGGRGGPGGGDSAHLPLTALLRAEPVREELEIMPDQEDALRKMGEQQQQRGQGGERPNFRDMSEEERTELFAKMQKEREERTEEAHMMLEQILLPPQLDRLREIAIQVAGVQALTTTFVSTELKITDKQKDELKKKREEAGAKMREEMMAMFSGRGGRPGGDRERPEGAQGDRPPRGQRPEGGQGGDRGGFDRDAMRTKFEEMRKNVETDVMTVLSSEQRSEFEKLKGKKFEMPEGFGRGGPGGRGGDQGGDRRRGGRPQTEE